MNTLSQKELPIIYGIILRSNIPYGVQAYSIDGQTGEVIDQHFCSSEGFAKSDLGFTDPILLKWDSFSDETHSTVRFNQERKKKYLERYPNGYTMEWVGYLENNPMVSSLWKNKALVDSIDLKKIFWAFWQSSFCYDYDNGYVCMFNVYIKQLDSDGNVLLPEDKVKSEDFYHCGEFSLYKTFKMKNGKMGVEMNRPVLSFFYKQQCIETTENVFKANGIAECYLKSQDGIR